MAIIWRSHQVCDRCGWTGVTAAHRRIIASGLAYLFACVVFLILDGLGVLNIKAILATPLGPLVIGAALVWFHLVPYLLWRANACGGCQQRMPKKLVSGHPPRPVQPSAGTTSAAHRL